MLLVWVIVGGGAALYLGIGSIHPARKGANARFLIRQAPLSDSVQQFPQAPVVKGSALPLMLVDQPRKQNPRHVDRIRTSSV